MGGKFTFQDLRTRIAACDICVPHLPLGPRPVVQFSSTSSVVIIGQAPGTKVHESGVPWDDNSGVHLREWLQIDHSTFYDVRHVAIVPMGFCYPGKSSGGDAPPRPECAPQWHAKVLSELPKSRLTILCGQYAQRHYLGQLMKRNLTETVRAFEQYMPSFIPLPHPSWRSKIWMKKNPWFEDRVLPVLRSTVASYIRESPR